MSNLKKGDCYLAKPQNSTVPHMYIIISDCAPDGKVLAVNITDYGDGDGVDHSCIVREGDHSYVTKKSYAIYRHMGAFDLRGIQNMVDYEECEQLEPASDALLERVQEGAGKSDHVRFYLYKYFEHF